jgi:hypothetical protein
VWSRKLDRAFSQTLRYTDSQAKPSLRTHTRTEAPFVNLLSYIAPGDEHTVLSDGPT